MSTSSPSAHRRKSNNDLPCSVSSPAQSGRSGARASTSLVTSPCRKPRTSSPARRSKARSARGVPLIRLCSGESVTEPPRLVIRRPDDWHVHLRDGEMLEAVAGHSARQFARAIVMPNLDPPVTGVAAAEAYRTRILAALPTGSDFTPLMTAYLVDRAEPAELVRGFEEGVFAAAKLYPAHATTNSAHGGRDIGTLRACEEGVFAASKLYPAHATNNSAHGVRDIGPLAPALEAMQRIGMPPARAR